MSRPAAHRAPDLSGVYAVFGPRGIYVGESVGILKRLRYGIYMRAYRRAGLAVVSQMNGEWASAMLLRMTPDERRARARSGIAARKLTRAQQAAYGRLSAGGGSRFDKLPLARRREISRLGLRARWGAKTTGGAGLFDES